MGSREDFVFVDTDMLRWILEGDAGEGDVDSGGGTSVTTVRRGDPAEVHVQARHERNTPGRGEHGC
ncbi:hypothetical protein GCM10010451_11150 [Streptomyces virens]|uniref:Uncharacterized protein n=1 Tax=Streptomyces virens TaxID=285572 RepID=A0ABP6P276_9ACTN|nr:hypothetical protein GCM10010247_60840 [Streptomyces calvus]